MKRIKNWIRRRKGMNVLRRELLYFSDVGLDRLVEDLQKWRVGRWSWDTCPLSYRRGGPGSVDQDTEFEPGNAFTFAWDTGIIKDTDVLRVAQKEIKKRNVEITTAWDSKWISRQDVI